MGGLVDARRLLACAAARPVFGLSDTDLVTALDHLRVIESCVQALQASVLREVDGRALAIAQGASSTTVWLRERHRVGNRHAGAQVGLARALADLPTLAASLAAGAVNTQQAQVIAHAVADLPADLGAELTGKAETQLVEFAAQHGPEQLRTLGAHILSIVAPDVAEQHEHDALQRAEKRASQTRTLSLSPDGRGRVRLYGWLSTEAAATLTAAMQPLLRPAGPDDQRTPGQRRADALTGICNLALATGDLPRNGGDKTQIVVTTHYDTLQQQLRTATLDDGATLPAETVRRLACDAAIIPAVLDSTGQPLDLGRERRLFSTALRRALILRDGGCAFPGCDRPPKWCEGHHIRHWSKGGHTNLTNGVLLCGHHHRLIHQGDWTVHIAPDGQPEFIPPVYIDPTRAPRRNQYHRRP